MSEEALIDHCSPTLAGIKTGNLFRLAYATKGEMTSSVRGWNKSLRDKGLRVVPLEYRDGYALLYVYRPALLSGDLLCDGVRERHLQRRAGRRRARKLPRPRKSARMREKTEKGHGNLKNGIALATPFDFYPRNVFKFFSLSLGKSVRRCVKSAS